MKYKIIRKTFKVPEYGYNEPRTITKQFLMYGRRTIDEEIVPEDVIIELGCLGSTNWKSKWAYTHPECY